MWAGRVRGHPRSRAAIRGVQSGVDVSPTDSQRRWRLVRFDCVAASCGWVATDPDGEGPELLFTSDEPLVSPMPSPDGKRLVYIGASTARLIVRTLATQTEVDLGWQGKPECVSWSPDGRLLAVIDYDEVARLGSVNVVRPDGTGRRVLTTGLFNPLLASWSPDGTHLLVTRSTGQLDLIDATTGAVERQIDDYGEWAVWTPDGRQIVYTRNRESPPALYVVNSDGSNRQQVVLTDPPDPLNVLASFVWPTVSPDGRYVVALRNGLTLGGIFRVTLDGRRVRWSNGELFLTGGRHFWLPVD